MPIGIETGDGAPSDKPAEPPADFPRETRAAQAALAAGKWLGLDDAFLQALVDPDLSATKPAVDRDAAAQLAYVAKSLRRLVRHPSIARRWLHGPNTGLGMRPIELLRSPGGLKLLHDYLTQFEPR